MFFSILVQFRLRHASNRFAAVIAISLGGSHSMSIGTCFTRADHQRVLFHGYFGIFDAHPALAATHAVGPCRICLAIASSLRSFPSQVLGGAK